MIAAIAATLSLFQGSVPISINDLHHLSSSQALILKMRLSRVITAFLMGALLAASGAALQGLLQNPLAEPYILGVSSGAAVGAVTAILFIPIFSMAIITIGAFFGGLLSMLCVITLMRFLRTNTLTHYILIGMSINALFSAIMMLLLYFSGQQLQTVMFWLMGHIDYMPLPNLLILIIIVIPLVMLLIRQGYPLNMLALGDDVAQSSGMTIKRTQLFVLMLTTILTGISVAISGMIGFIGLVTPHIIRQFCYEDYRALIPLSAIAGGALMLLADLASRILLPHQILPIGLLTSLLGAPFFIWILIKKNREL